MAAPSGGRAAGRGDAGEPMRLDSGGRESDSFDLVAVRIPHESGVIVVILFRPQAGVTVADSTICDCHSEERVNCVSPFDFKCYMYTIDRKSTRLNSSH